MTKKIFILFKKNTEEIPVINRLYVLEKKEDNYGYVDGLKFEELSSIISNVFGDLGLESLPSIGFNPDRISISDYYDLSKSNIYFDENVSLAFDYLEIANNFASQGIDIPLSIGNSSERIVSREIDEETIIFIYPDDTLDYKFENKIVASNIEVLLNETVFYDELNQISLNQYLIYNEDLEYNNSLNSLKTKSSIEIEIMNNDENCPADASNDTSETVSNSDSSIIFTSNNITNSNKLGFQILTVDQLPYV